MVNYIVFDRHSKDPSPGKFKEKYIKKDPRIIEQWLQHQGFSQNWVLQDYDLFKNKDKLNKWLNLIKQGDRILLFNEPPNDIKYLLSDKPVYMIYPRSLNGVSGYYTEKLKI